MLLALRAAADAVLIGPSTVRAEGYGQLVSADRRADTPPAVLISRRFDIPWEAGLFEAAGQPVLIYTSIEAGDPPEVAAPVEVVRLEVCSPAAALADLRARGVRALLSEGGPTLFGGFLEAGLVDELFLTLTPMATGDETEISILRGGRLADPANFASALGVTGRRRAVPALREHPLTSSRMVWRLAVTFVFLLALPASARAADVSVSTAACSSSPPPRGRSTTSRSSRRPRAP